MRRSLLFVVLLLAFAGVQLPTLAYSAPSENTCNQGTMMAHSKIPHDSPGHGHVPECE